MKKQMVFVFIVFLWFCTVVSGETVYVADIEGIIAEGTVNQFEKAIETAEENQAVLLIRLDTNGGLTNAMEKIIKKIENARVPVVIYVSPAGAVAFSAGTFILMAADIAAMENTTVIGACQPRVINPATGLAETAGEKEINAFAALMKSLAISHNRNDTLAEKFVTENLALNEQEAKEYGIIEVVAGSLEELLVKLDGWEIEINDEVYTINTSGLEIKKIQWGIKDKFINILSDPQIASLLLTIGIFGLIFGFITPGFHLPETLGGIFIILALYGLSLIGVNTAGVLLIALAFMFVIIEVITPTFGFWTGAAIITFIFGIVLIPAEDAMYEMPAAWFTTFRVASIALVIIIGVFFMYALAKALEAKKVKPLIGREDLIGFEGRAITDIEKKGQVKIRGEIWMAESDETIKEGETVVVVDQKRMMVKVKKA
jgi:membrane-bound serine protease (ClpP class)